MAERIEAAGIVALRDGRQVTIRPLQEEDRAALEAFVLRAFDDGWRAVLVITGKGVQGDGVLRKRVPDWLGAPHLAHVVAGLSEAARHHGGAGALYVALKRKARG